MDCQAFFYNMCLILLISSSLYLFLLANIPIVGTANGLINKPTFVAFRQQYGNAYRSGKIINQFNDYEGNKHLEAHIACVILAVIFHVIEIAFIQDEMEA